MARSAGRPTGDQRQGKRQKARTCVRRTLVRIRHSLGTHRGPGQHFLGLSGLLLKLRRLDLSTSEEAGEQNPTAAGFSSQPGGWGDPAEGGAEPTGPCWFGRLSWDDAEVTRGSREGSGRWWGRSREAGQWVTQGGGMPRPAGCPGQHGLRASVPGSAQWVFSSHGANEEQPPGIS